MTEQFFGKELAARKIDAIPGLLEFDIPVHGDNPCDRQSLQGQLLGHSANVELFRCTEQLARDFRECLYPTKQSHVP